MIRSHWRPFISAQPTTLFHHKMSEIPREPVINLRPMTGSDLEQVTALDRESFQTPWPEEAFVYDLQRIHSAICWVAEMDHPDAGKLLVGMIVVWVNGEKAHIGTLAVKPGYRRRGIAQHLLAEALLECNRRQVQQVTLEARIGNQKAQQLYQRFGFQQVGLKQGYYQDSNEDAILMLLTPLDTEQLADLADYGYH